MPACEASADRAENGMMAGIMARDTADDRAFNAPFGVSGGNRGDQKSRDAKGKTGITHG
jgi:hypothetical protein